MRGGKKVFFRLNILHGKRRELHLNERLDKAARNFLKVIISNFPIPTEGVTFFSTLLDSYFVCVRHWIIFSSHIKIFLFVIIRYLSLWQGTNERLLKSGNKIIMFGDVRKSRQAFELIWIICKIQQFENVKQFTNDPQGISHSNPLRLIFDRKIKRQNNLKTPFVLNLS